MRDNGNRRGRGGRGRGRGGSNRNDRNGGRPYRGGGGGGRGGYRGRGRGPQRGSSESGNQRERIAVESGYLVFIDQFMLANPQFIEKVASVVDGDPELKDQIIRDYGGSVVVVQPGTYRIERDAYKYTIVVHAEGQSAEMQQLPELATESHGHVFVDTRCLAMIDRELLDDGDLLRKYQQLWFSGQDKACRDLLRDNGGAVRYGFQRLGDELGIYKIPEEDIVCLWPDVANDAAALEDSAAG